MVTGSKEVCRGSQENLVMYRSFFFLSFFFFESFRLRLFPFFFWLDRLVFFFFFLFFFGFLVELVEGGSRSMEGIYAIFPWNFRNEIRFAYACLVGGLIHRTVVASVRQLFQGRFRCSVRFEPWLLTLIILRVNGDLMADKGCVTIVTNL